MTALCPQCGSSRVHWKTKAREWECLDCELRFGDEGGEANAALSAEVDLAHCYRARALGNHDDWIEVISARWPGPVAYTYRLLRQLLRNGQIDAAAWVFKDFAELLARLSALILAQDLIEHGSAQSAKEICNEFFGMPPSMGVWARLAMMWSAQVQQASEQMFFPEITHLWRTRDGRQTAFSRLMGEHIVKWRNEVIGHGVRGADVGPTLNALERFLGVTEQSLHSALRPMAEIWADVTLCDGDGDVLMGADSSVAEGDGHHTFELPVGVHLRRGDRQLDLRPWISIRRCQICGQSEIFLYDSTRARKTALSFRLVNYEKGHPYSLSGSADPQMIEHYGAADAPVTVASDEDFNQASLSGETARLLDEQSVENDYLSPAYLRAPLRQVIEVAIMQGQGAVFWLQAPAHVGKSTFVRGLDPAYRAQFKEDPLLGPLAVATFYIRREYQFHLAQFADQLRDKMKAVLDIRAHNKPLPSLDIERPSPKALCEFLGAFQRLTQKPMLVVIDGLDELADEHPGIADYLPSANMMPPHVTLLVTSRWIEEFPLWLRGRVDALSDAQLRRIDLNDGQYVALMNHYAASRLEKKYRDDEELLKTLREKSDGRFLYFAFLVQRLRDGDLRVTDADSLATPDQLVPQYLDALHLRYAHTSVNDLIKRILLWMVATEEAYGRHNARLPTLVQEAWKGLPMDVLCMAVDGQPDISPRVTHALYLIKPLLATWRGDAGVSFYRLGIKGLSELLHERYAVELDELSDDLVLRLLRSASIQEGWTIAMELAGEAPPQTERTPRGLDLDWVADYFDGFARPLSANARDALFGDPAWIGAVRIVKERINEGKANARRGLDHLAVSHCGVALRMLDWLQGCGSTNGRLEELFLVLRLTALDSLGRSLRKIGDLKEAIVVQRETIQIFESLGDGLAALETVDRSCKLANAYGNLATTLAATYDSVGALDTSAKEIATWTELRERLGQRFTELMTNQLATAYANRGIELNFIGDTLGSGASFAEAFRILEPLRKQQREVASRIQTVR